MAALGVLFFVVALLGSIALHELGHLVTAKRYGMKATRYFIGMGPTLWSTRRGETEYGIKGLPIGGFVKIVGMTQYDDVEPEDEPRAFWRQPAPKRAVVLAAGSFMHFVIAFLVLVGVVAVYGEPTTDTTRVAAVSECLEPDEQTGSCAGKPPAPAKSAGLRDGDRIVSFEGTPVATWDEFTSLVRKHPGGAAEVVVDRDGQRVTLRPVVERHVRVIDEAGTEAEVGQIGVTPGDTKTYNPIAAVGRAGAMMGELTVASVRGVAELPGKIPQLFKETADTDTPRGAGGGAPIVGVLDIGRLAAQAFEAGRLDALLMIVASLNVFIGLFNLLPLLPLDGGHLAVLGFESARSRIARRLGRPDPGRVDLQKLMPATVAFIVLMASLTVMLLYAGIANPLANPF